MGWSRYPYRRRYPAHARQVRAPSERRRLPPQERRFPRLLRQNHRQSWVRAWNPSFGRCLGVASSFSPNLARIPFKSAMRWTGLLGPVRRRFRCDRDHQSHQQKGTRAKSGAGERGATSLRNNQGAFFVAGLLGAHGSGPGAPRAKRARFLGSLAVGGGVNPRINDAGKPGC